MGEDKYEAYAAGLPRDAVLSEDGDLNVAFLRINLNTFQIGFHWLPELFRAPIPPVIRQELAKRLHTHADKLESGELEREMQQYMNINDATRIDD